MSKLSRINAVLFEYLYDFPSQTRLRIRAMQVFLMYATLYFGENAIIGLLAFEVVNFIVWYRKIRTGELEEKRQEILGGIGR